LQYIVTTSLLKNSVAKSTDYKQQQQQKRGKSNDFKGRVG